MVAWRAVNTAASGFPKAVAPAGEAGLRHCAGWHAEACCDWWRPTAWCGGVLCERADCRFLLLPLSETAHRIAEDGTQTMYEQGGLYAQRAGGAGS